MNNDIIIDHMSIYEKAKVIGDRAVQISNGSKPNIEIQDKTLNAKQIALMELRARKCPLKIVKKGKMVSVNDLIIP